MSHYRPSAISGRNRPVCCFYILEGEGAGGLYQADHFMCEYWLQARETCGE
ncbi:MAG: hypothetical protein JW950_06225 [Deltaproteobacteria bacterium]|nr:hypothetical protein [Deltaproteobacteria bacterium]